MKIGKAFLLTIAAITIVLQLSAVMLVVGAAPAIQDDAKGKASVAAKKPGKAAVYTCVHHPDITSDSADTCPKCLMVLTKKSKIKPKRS